MRRAAVLASALLLLCGGCRSTFARTDARAADRAAAYGGETLFDSLHGLGQTDGDVREPARREFSVPSSLRPCCAFGHDLTVSLGPVPVPGYKLHNVVQSEELGRHRYDGGMLSLNGDIRSGFIASENNGLAYTCRGGFIDTAHVRDYADWTVFLAQEIEARAHTGGVLALPREGGRRFIYITSLDDALIERADVREVSLRIAQWLAFQLSLWHETATWYGWSSIDLFPELASAFSPEDLYSNMLGIGIAGAVVRANPVLARDQYNRDMDVAFHQVLGRLGVLPREATNHAAASIDGRWWDSRERLPSKRLVLRRNLDTGPEIAPWQIAPEHQSPELATDLSRSCPGGTDAIRLPNPDHVFSALLRDLARLDVRVGDVADSFPFPEAGSHWIDQADLTAIVAAARQENRNEFGEFSDHP